MFTILPSNKRKRIKSFFERQKEDAIPPLRDLQCMICLEEFPVKNLNIQRHKNGHLFNGIDKQRLRHANHGTSRERTWKTPYYSWSHVSKSLKIWRKSVSKYFVEFLNSSKKISKKDRQPQNRKRKNQLFWLTCGHVFCFSCLIRYVSYIFQQHPRQRQSLGGDLHVPCPTMRCKTPLLEGECFEIACQDPELHRQFMALYALLYHPTSGSSQPEHLATKNQQALQHNGNENPTGERILQQNIASDATFIRLANGQHWKRCPGCGVMVEKVNGCHYVTCTLCLTCFCYQCGGTPCHCHLRSYF